MSTLEQDLESVAVPLASQAADALVTATADKVAASSPETAALIEAATPLINHAVNTALAAADAQKAVALTPMLGSVESAGPVTAVLHNSSVSDIAKAVVPSVLNGVHAAMQSSTAAPTTKAFWQSKTVWFNGLSALGLGLASSMPQLQSVMTPETYTWAGIAVTAANLLLRGLTTKGISLSGSF